MSLEALEDRTLLSIPGSNGLVAFSSDRDGDNEIFRMNADGTGQTQITFNSASDTQPIWSPDGTRIAFVSNRDGNNEIYVMNAAGSGQTRLTNNSDDDREPSWSPDGSKIAFRSFRGGNNDIYVMNANGTGETQLTTVAAHDVQPNWSPDGLMIAFVSDRDTGGGFGNVFVMNADGSGQTNLNFDFSDNTFPNWSPDGTRIAFQSNRTGNLEIFAINSDGSGLTNLTVNAANDRLPAYSPDGGKIAFASDRDDAAIDLYVMDTDGANQTRIVTNLGLTDNDPDWQPVHSVTVPGDLLVMDPDAFGGGGGILRVNPTTGVQTTVASGGSFVDPYNVAFEANGDLVVVDVNAGGSGAVFRVNPASGGQTVVASGSFSNPFGIAVESDGSILVADRGPGGNDGSIFRIDSTTGATSVLATGDLLNASTSVAVEANGNIVVANFGTNNGVIRIDPQTGAQSALATGGNFATPLGIALEANGNIVVADGAASVSGAVIRVDPVSGAQTFVSMDGGFSFPFGVGIATNTDILVADPTSLGSGAIFRVDPVGGAQTTVSSGGIFTNPRGVKVANMLAFTAPSGNGADTITLRRSGANLELLAGGVLQASVSLAATQSIVIAGAAGEDDTLTIDFGSGFFTVPGGIRFDGGTGGNDSLRMIGTGTTTGNYMPSGTTPGAGTVTVTFGGTTTVNFTGLEPVEVSNMASFTLTTPNAADILLVDSPATGRNRVSGTSGGVPIEGLTFFDVVSFILDAAADPVGLPDDAITLGSAGLVANGLAGFTLMTGSGADAFIVESRSLALPVGGGTIAFDAGDDVDQISANTDAGYTLTDTTLSSSFGGTLSLVNFAGEQAHITPSDGPVSWFQAEGNGNDSADGNSGSLVGGVTFDAGQVGQAFSLDGSDDWVDLGDPANLRLASAVTLSAWINPTDYPEDGNLKAIITKWGQNASCSPFSDSYAIWLQKSGGVTGIFAAIHRTDFGEPTLIGGDVAPNVWSHVALSFDSATGLMAIYLNGAVVSSTNIGATPLCESNKSVRIGSEDSFLENARAFPGRIDEAEVYNRGLSAAEIAALHVEGLAGIHAHVNSYNVNNWTGAVTLDGGAGDDTYILNFVGFGSGSVFLNDTGGTGQDVVTLNGTPLDDSIAVSVLLPNIEITNNGNEKIIVPSTGGIDDGTIFGGAGNDFMDASGSLGGMNFDGGAGNDTMLGGTEGDELVGGAGDDCLNGGAGDDLMDGGADNDTYVEAPGSADVLTDSGGIDLIDFSGAAGSITINLSIDDGTPQLVDGANTVALNGTFEHAIGSFFADTIIGSAANNSLSGGAGNDSLTGGAGDDTLAGEGDTDRLVESGDVSFALTDTSLGGLGTDLLDSLEEASLSGGNGLNSFTVSDWSGSASLQGGGGNDSLTVTFQGLGSGSVSFFDTAGTDSATVLGTAGSDSIVLTSTSIALASELFMYDSSLDNLTVNGLGDNDTFTVNGSATTLLGGTGDDVFDINAVGTAGLAVDGGAGGDSYDVTFGALGSAVTIQDTGAAGFDAATLAGTGGDDNFTVSQTATTLAGQTVSYNANLEHVFVQGLDGNDTFGVTLSTGPSYGINGGSDTTGDIINLNVAGNSVFAFSFAISVTGFENVGFSLVETVNITGTNPAATTILAAGDENDNSISLTGNTATTGSFIFETGPTFTFTAIQQFLMEGNGGDDDFAITNPAGSLFAPGGGISVSGSGNGAGGDSLLLRGGGGALFSETYSVGATSDAGTVTTTNGVTTQTVSFTGLEPISDLVTVDDLTVNGTGGGDTINVVNGPFVEGGFTTEVNFNGAFELVRFRNKTFVTVAGLGGNDTMTLNTSVAAPGLQTLTLAGGSGTDTFAMTASAGAGVAYVLSGGANDDSMDVAASGGNATLDGSAGADDYAVHFGSLLGLVTIDDSGTDAGVDTAAIFGTAGNDNSGAGTAIVFNGTSIVRGGETITVPTAGLSLESLTIDGLNGQDEIDFATWDAPITLTGGNGDDTITGGTASDLIEGEDGNDQLFGGAGNDTLEDGTGDDTMNGGANDDTYEVYTGPIASTADAIIDSGGNDTANFSDADFGITIDLDLNAGEVQTVDSNGDTIAITGVIENFIGSGFNDSVMVEPLAVARSISGGSHTTNPPGDTLTVNALGGTASVTPTIVNIAGFAAINFSTIETINLNSTDGVIQVNGDSSANTLVVNATNTTDGNYVLNGTFRVNFTAPGSFAFDAGGGSDTFTINNPVGSLFAPAGGISYFGGGQSGDSLVLSGGGGASFSETYSVGPTAGDGTIVTTNGAGTTQSINFTGLAPLTDTVPAASLAINGTDAANAITVDDGTATLDNMIRVTVDAFEPMEFANKTAVTINAGLTGTDLGDTIAINLTEIAAGLTSLTVNGGAGDDTFNIRAMAGGLPPTLNGDGGNDTFNISSNAATNTGTLDGILSSINIFAGAGSNTLAVSDSGDADADTNVVVTSSSITGLAPAAINYSATGTFAGGISVNAGSGGDTINVRSTLAGATTTVNSGGGNDTFNVSSDAPTNTGTLAGLSGTLTLDAGAGSNTLAVSESGSAASDTVSLSSTAISSAVVQFTINYSATGGNFSGGVLLQTGTAGDAVNILSTIAAATTTVNTGEGADAVTITSTSGATSVVGGGASDTLTGPNTLNTWNITAANAGNIGGAGVVDFSAFENLTGGTFIDSFVFSNGVGVTGSINGSGGSDTLDYSSYFAANRVTVNLATGTATGVGGTIASIESLTGGAASDILIGADAANTWNITANDGGNIGGTFSFGSIENLIGGSAADSFVFSPGVGVTGTINGSGGSDTLNYASYSTAVATTLKNGGAFGGPVDGTQEVPPSGSAATGSASLTIDLTTNVFSINVFVSGISLANLMMSHIHVAAPGVNGGIIFDLGTAGWYSDGPGIHLVSSGLAFPGANVADLLAGNTYVNVHTSTVPGGEVRGQLLAQSRNFGISTGMGGFASVESLAGGSATDSLTGLNAAATWGLDGTENYTSGATSIDFSAVEHLIGGSGVDAFDVSANHTGNLTGGASDDVFHLSGSAVVAGLIDGGTSATLSFAGYSTGRNVVLTGPGSFDGFAGTEASITGGFDNITTLVGSGNFDRLTGYDVVSTWGVGVTLTYNDGSTNTLAFSDFDQLNGGPNVDVFNISANNAVFLNGGDGNDSFNFTSNGIVLTGNIFGMSGTNSLSLAGYTNATTVALIGHSGGFTGTSGALAIGSRFFNIHSLIGGAGADSLTGMDVMSTWDIDGSNTYTDGVDTLAFSAVENLAGGSGIDTFNVSANHTGNLSGQGGVDVFNLSGSGVLSGSINGGSSATLSFSSYSSARTLTLTGLGSIDGFAGTEASMTGGFDNITNVVGSAGSDTLTGRNAAAAWGVDGSNDYASTNTLQFSSFENLTGGAGPDTFTLTGAQTAALTGGTGDDVFAFSNAATLTGTINGQGGNDTLSYAAYLTAMIVNLSTGSATGVNAAAAGAVTSIETAIGGAGADSLTGGAGNERFVGGPGNDTTRGGGGDDTMAGGAGNDSLDGGTGSNWVDFSAATGAVQINLAKRTVKGEGTDKLVTVDNAIGSAFADKFTGSSLNNILWGGAGNDTMAGGSGNDGVVGGAGNDTITDASGRNILIGGTGTDRLTGSSGDDILIAGSTDFDLNDTALRAILAEWSSALPTHVYATRVANLRDGTGSADRLNGGFFLSATTVHDDAIADTLAGKKGLDWFLARTTVPTLDTLVDRVLATELADAI